MHKPLYFSLMVLFSTTPALAQTRGVVVPIPDAIARGLGVLEAVTGQNLLAPLQTVTQPRFGASGQLLLGGASSLLVAGEHHQLGEYRDNAMAVDVRLSAGTFVVKNMLVGLTGGVGAQLFTRDSAPLTGHIGPMAGYNIRIHEHASMLPVLALTYDTFARTPVLDVRHHTVNVGVDFAFVMQLSDHIALSMAPFIKQSVYHGLQGNDLDQSSVELATWDTAYGVKVGILGWL